MTENLKLVKPSKYGKEMENKIFDAASKGELTAFDKHKKTAAVIPIENEIIKKMKSGESFDIGDAERKHNRRFFKVEKLTIRWDMEPNSIVKILQEFEVPCFFKPDEVEHDGISAIVGCGDICVFEEYILAIEKKRNLKKNHVKMNKYHGHLL